MAKQTKPAAKPAATPAEVSAAPVSPSEGGLADYIVSDKAPERVAGRRVIKGQTIRLSEAEARGELLALHILVACMPETEPQSGDN